MELLSTKSFIRPIIIGSCIVIGGILLSGCGNTPAITSATTFKEAQILYDLGKNQEALSFFNQKLSNNSSDFASFITRGKILVKLGRYDDAINDFYKASKLDNNKSTYMLYKGLVTMQSAVDANALDALDLSGTENMDMFTFYKCALLYQLNKIKDASVCLDKLMAIDNNNPQGNFLKWMTLFKGWKYKDSIKYFNKAEEGGLDTKELRSNKGIALARVGDSESITYLDKALALDGGDTEALYAKALALFDSEEYKVWLISIDRAISINSADKTYYILKWDLLMQLKDYDQAIVSYDKAFALDGKNSYALAKKAVAEFRAWDIKSMDATFVQAKTIIPNNIHMYCNLATAFIIVGKYNDAMIYADKALAINPLHMLAKFDKALAYYLLGKSGDADLRYASLRGNKLVNYEAKLVMANYKIVSQDYVAASTLISEVLKADPTNEIAIATKIKLYIEMDRSGKTIADKKFDYTTPWVVADALTKLNKYSFLKNYR